MTPRWMIKYHASIERGTPAIHEVTNNESSFHLTSGSEAQRLLTILNKLEYRSFCYDNLRAQFSAGEGKA